MLRAGAVLDAPNCTLVELKFNNFGGSGWGLTPNCTLVELKYKVGNMAKVLVKHSKLYLSGIEICIQPFNAHYIIITPNCTLVELKLRTASMIIGENGSPNCTLVELK